MVPLAPPCPVPCAKIFLAHGSAAGRRHSTAALRSSWAGCDSTTGSHWGASNKTPRGPQGQSFPLGQSETKPLSTFHRASSAQTFSTTTWTSRRTHHQRHDRHRQRHDRQNNHVPTRTTTPTPPRNGPPPAKTPTATATPHSPLPLPHPPPLHPPLNLPPPPPAPLPQPPHNNLPRPPPYPYPANQPIPHPPTPTSPPAPPAPQPLPPQQQEEPNPRPPAHHPPPPLPHLPPHLPRIPAHLLHHAILLHPPRHRLASLLGPPPAHDAVVRRPHRTGKRPRAAPPGCPLPFMFGADSAGLARRGQRTGEGTTAGAGGGGAEFARVGV